jgi:hypothetical protein
MNEEMMAAMQQQGGQAPADPMQDLMGMIQEIGQMVAEIHQATVGGQQAEPDEDEALRQEALARLAAKQG